MLIEFRITNFRSIKEEQTLSMVASANKELEDSHTFHVENITQRLLRSAAVYGPNASGKTNLLRALGVMKNIVEESAFGRHSGDLLPVELFKLDSELINMPTKFEVVFVAEGVRYRYGFSATRQRVVGEWLLTFPEGRTRRWFERKWDEGGYKWDFGPSLKGEKTLWRKSTRDNALFLSTAMHLNSQQLQPVYNWFKNTLHLFFNPDGWLGNFSASLCEESGKGKKSILEFLQAADLGIDDLNVKKEPFNPKMLPEDMPDALKQFIVEQAKDEDVFEVKTVHRNSTGELVEFDLKDESDGTRNFFFLAGPIIDCLDKGNVICIDELHNSLHAVLVKFLVGLFNNKTRNKLNAQLIFTTHETGMLDQKILRRDQVWFCEKDKTQATQVYPLSDFRPRKGRENLELAYLSGRYGALPYISESE